MGAMLDSKSKGGQVLDQISFYNGIIFWMRALCKSLISKQSISKYNPHIPNIDAISGALFTLRIQYEYTQTQCDEDARDGIDIWYIGVTRALGRGHGPVHGQVDGVVDDLVHGPEIIRSFAKNWIELLWNVIIFIVNDMIAE